MINARTRPTFRKSVEDHLDALFRELIRKRAMKRSKGCEFSHELKWDYLALETAHCFGRGHHTVRWDPRNAVGVAPKWHRYLDDHPEVKLEFFRRLLGDEEYERLLGLAQKTTKDAPVDYDKIESQLKEALKEVS